MLLSVAVSVRVAVRVLCFFFIPTNDIVLSM